METVSGFTGLIILNLVAAASIVAQSPTVSSVWNHAYRENKGIDSPEDIVSGARNAYILLIAFNDEKTRTAIPLLKERETSQASI